jgi:TPR repeat protein
VAKDENKAAELYRRACDAGNADGCANLEKLNVKR